MAKIDELTQRYPNTSKSTVRIFNELDTTPTKKYLPYLFQTWNRRKSISNFSWSSRQLSTWVMAFDSLLPYIENKDIYSKDYLDLFFLRDVVTKAEETKQEKLFVKEDHVEVVLENENFFIIRPLTIEGSIKYGSGTKWCTTMKNYCYFKDYTSANYLYYVISKKERNKNYNKLAILTEGKKNIMTGNIKIWNESDVEVKESTVINNQWTFFEIFEIFTTIKTRSYEMSVFDQTKKDVDTVINTLNSINFEELMKKIQLIGNQEKNIGEEYKQKLDNVLNFLSIKINK
jgi:hypothetical protein